MWQVVPVNTLQVVSSFVSLAPQDISTMTASSASSGSPADPITLKSVRIITSGRNMDVSY